MEISIFGVENVFKAEDKIKELESGKTKITEEALKEVEFDLRLVRLSDYPWRYQIRSLEERYNSLRKQFN